MISRRTASAVADVYEKKFGYTKRERGRDYTSVTYHYYVYRNELYDFLFDRGYQPWFCNAAQSVHSHDYSLKNRAVKDLVMKLHTGETLANATPNMDWEERQKVGQRYLEDLTGDILSYWQQEADQREKEQIAREVTVLRGRLELDGYEYRDSYLLAPESDVLDVEEESGVIERLYTTLSLADKETTCHHLKLSEEHYLEERWDDSISNSRKFLESVLREVATAHSSRVAGRPLADSIYEKPFRVRNYLEEAAVIETKEKETIASVYGLLSNTGGHPYMARSDQARLLQHLALTFSQFAMLRFQGALG